MIHSNILPVYANVCCIHERGKTEWSTFSTTCLNEFPSYVGIENIAVVVYCVNTNVMLLQIMRFIARLIVLVDLWHRNSQG